MPVPQNLQARAQQAGQSLQDFGNNFSSSISGQLQNSANILTNGVRSSVEGSINELRSAVQRPFTAINSLFSGLNNIFGGGSGGGGYTTYGSAGSSGSPDIIGTSGQTYSGGPIENPLSEFASCNYIWTLGVLTNEEVNYPDATYRKNGVNLVVLRSGGTGSTQVRTTFEKELGITAEYFIDDVEIETLIAPSQKTKQTNATSIKFMVLEPYSMGVFLQTLMETALAAKYKNYLDAPYVLMLEFIGWDDSGSPTVVPNTKRIFPLKFSNITFDVDAGGSRYNVEAIPWNEVALADDVQTSKSTTDFQGSTIVEMLQTGTNSLTSVLNKRESDLVAAGSKKVANEYVVMFPTSRTSAAEGATGSAPTSQGATTASQINTADGLLVTGIPNTIQSQELIAGIQNGDVPADFDSAANVGNNAVVRRGQLGQSFREFAEKPENTNAIGNSKIVKSYLDSGKPIFGRPAFAKGKTEGTFTRGSITVSDEGRRISFRSGTRIQDMIEEVILLSEYGRQFATQNPNDRGMKTWFKVETDVYVKADTENSDQTGAYGKIYVYRVIPYEVSTARLNSPTQPTPGIQNLRRQAMKEYNYIYTGKNDDIIDFKIELNYAFFTAIQADYGQATQSQVTGLSNNAANPGANPVFGQAQGRNDTFSSSGNARVANTSGSNTGGQGSGSVQVHPETQVARNFNDAIVNSNVDLVMAEMDIWGDPYYIADSGMGNYNASGGASTNITADGSMDYQYGEVDVLVNFRTPIDYGDDGLMKFPGLGSKPVAQFSGLYQVTMVRNKFSQNTFTQMLTMLRRRNQEGVDTIAPAVDTNTETVVERGEEARVVSSPSATAGTFAGADAQAGSNNGTGGPASQGTGSRSATADDSGSATPTRGTVGYGVGQVDPRLNAAATENERRRIEQVQQDRARGINRGF